MGLNAVSTRNRYNNIADALRARMKIERGTVVKAKSKITAKVKLLWKARNLRMRCYFGK
jgi:hypothetical protein